MKEQTTIAVDADVKTRPFEEAPCNQQQLKQQLAHAIRLATSARIHNLSIRVTGTHIELHGFCSTFHCFQLAQHAAMQLADELLVDNQIEVL